MSEIEKDVLETKKVILSDTHRVNYDTYEKVYFSSNENCHDIISKLNVRNKNILSVLGSGDQAIEFYRNGVKKIDLFDINKVTYYYFYLRLWCMKFLGFLYPDKNFDNGFLKKLLKFVKPTSMGEYKAYEYWTMMSNTNIDNYFSLFYQDYHYDIDYVDNVDEVRNMIDDVDFNFYNVDLMDEVNIDKKYDLIYVSNISDYLKKRDCDCYNNNIYNLLNRNGQYVTTSFYWIGENEINKNNMRCFFKHPKIIEINSSFNAISYKKRLIKRDK